MLIGIDGNEANIKDRVGIGQYAYNILTHIHKLDKTNNYIIYLKNPPLYDLPKPSKNWQYCVFGPKKLWTRLALPIKLYTQNTPLDLFFSLSHYSPYFSSCPTICSIMDLGFLRYPGQFTKKDLYQLTNWTNHSIKKASHIIAISKFTKRQIIKKYNIQTEKITVAYPGVSTPISTTAKQSRLILSKFKIQKPYLLHFGTLKPSKNIPFLIKSFSKKNSPSLQLVIAGKKGWLFNNIFSTVKKLNLANKQTRSPPLVEQIIFTDYITEKQKWVLLKNAKALVIPSTYEGFGIIAIEAQKLGTPVLASNISILKEVLGNSAIFFNPRKQDELVNAIRQIINPKIHQKYSKLGQKNSKNFTWSIAAKRIIQVFNSIEIKK
ncbi:glycosyltransferase family 4 protein [Patescibacteria group bacterium]|nr:glycosyltransferase family 4 protein [Patescibacteria group bacterium]MCG2702123.1 glycosyltransferase family 4 protein [Candidatus Parcubacteria bacterium]MBU4265082.1 glycosyltransferase family 4 protein [Patescibacteria group bacterium]MBU4389678.1 glycosyltransferase family 4 protein [Patescibacteria group bacterium]MBU4397037.1 glycosyltransferase family 4 protein [Patescibacteria group bacterium]